MASRASSSPPYAAKREPLQFSHLVVSSTPCLAALHTRRMEARSHEWWAMRPQSSGGRWRSVLSGSGQMAFLTRQQLFMVFLLVTLVDATTLVREWHLGRRIGVWVAGVVLVMDLLLLWKLARMLPQQLPDPSYAVDG